MLVVEKAAVLRWKAFLSLFRVEFLSWAVPYILLGIISEGSWN